MSLSNARKAITDVLKTYTGAPNIYPENYTIPSGEFATEAVRWSVRLADVFDSTVGADKERAIGTLYFQHFLPENVGTLKAWAFADKIGAMFNRKMTGVGGVMTFGRAVCAYAGTTDGKVQHNITIEFRWDADALNAA